MGREERANPVAQASRAEIPASGDPNDLAGCPPSEYLEALARASLAQSIGQSNAIAELFKPRSVIAGPGGAPAGPQIDFPSTVLRNQAIILKGQAVILDLLLTFLTGKPDLKPMPGKVDG